MSIFFLTVWPALVAAVDDDPGRDTADLVTVGDAEAVAGLGAAEMLPKVLTCFGSVSVDGAAGDVDGGAELSSIDPNWTLDRPLDAEPGTGKVWINVSKYPGGLKCS